MGYVQLDPHLSIVLIRLVDIHVGGALGRLLVGLNLRDVVLRHWILLHLRDTVEIH